MSRFFSLVLIGYAFIIIDLNFGIDIIPDIIGYIIIARAIQKYAESKYNKTAVLLSYITGFISLIEMPIAYRLVESSPAEVNLLYGFISSIIQLLYFYYLFGVFNSFAQNTPYIKYTKRVKHLVVGSLWIVITSMYLIEFTQNIIVGFAVVIAGIVLIIGFIMFIIYCYKMMRYGKLLELREKEEQVETETT
ncbi:hypothetical protein NYE67_09915 [Solibacillus sp. FSL W8-0474]|uniref:hypothetical protein n=1 Tax=Solibacillus sp. FSL W8-0474 TaxID=2975336 RepID=UPI0030FB1CB3